MNFPNLGPEYLVVRLINSGGEADVYELWHAFTGSRYAGRVLREAWDPMAKQVFHDGIVRQLRASGPGIARILAYSPQAPKPFAVLEYMPGGSLADEMSRRKEPFSLGEALDLARLLAVALADVHAKNLAHLDFKPGNILKNGQGLWELADFGAAVTVGPQEILRASHWVLTPEYAAPEQLFGIKSQASDVFALGVVLTELLTGARKFALAGFVEFLGHGAWEIAALIGRLTSHEAKMRPTAREAVTLLADAARRAAPAVAPIIVSPPTARFIPRATSMPAPTSQPAISGLAVAGVFATMLLGGAAINRSTKTWDPKVRQYRGTNGKFRGGGMFE